MANNFIQWVFQMKIQKFIRRNFPNHKKKQKNLVNFYENLKKITKNQQFPLSYFDKTVKRKGEKPQTDHIATHLITNKIFSIQ